jgi:hypothetical protein
VLLDQGDQWKVKLAGEGGRWHRLSSEGPVIGLSEVIEA